MFILTDKLKEAIKAVAYLKSAEEVCGLIMQRDGSVFIFPCENAHINKIHFFKIDPRDYLEASQFGEILGCYHSQHDHQNLTNFDILQSLRLNLIYVCYCITTDTFDVHIPQYKVHPLHYLLNIPFKLGINDCYGLVRKYYLSQLGVELPDYERHTEWYENNPNIFMEEFNKVFKYFFYPVTVPQKHDVLMFKYLDDLEPHHLGVYLGNHEFIHHPRKRFSTIEQYSDSYVTRTAFIARYKDE